MFRAGVLGSPISHSLSPLLHNFAYESLGADGKYEAIEVKSGELHSFLEREFNSGSASENWRGFSLTMPLKEELVSLVSSTLPIEIKIEKSALISGSANTLYFSGEISPLTSKPIWIARSTDTTGFHRLFIERFPVGGIEIWGAGGTTRAILSALSQLSFHSSSMQNSDPALVTQSEEITFPHEIHIYNRSVEKVANLKEIFPQLNIISHRLDELNLSTVQGEVKNVNSLISTLPAPVQRDLLSQLSPHHFERFDLVFDVLYNPWPSILIEKYMEVRSRRGLSFSTVSGLDLLIEQGLDQIHLFSGKDFSYQNMRAKLLALSSEYLLNNS
jgi:shikimate dehydrogenase